MMFKEPRSPIVPPSPDKSVNMTPPKVDFVKEPAKKVEALKNHSYYIDTLDVISALK